MGQRKYRLDCGVATKEKYVEILEFTHFVEFFSFRKIGENHKEKSLVKKVTVVVALDLGTGNTKNQVAKQGKKQTQQKTMAEDMERKKK